MRPGPPLVVAVAVLLAGCVQSADDGAPPKEPSSPSKGLDCGQASYENATVVVQMVTDKGPFELTLNGSASPLTVCNFLRYATEDFYDHTLFHRICDGFVVQAGGYTRSALPLDYEARRGHEPIENEANRSGLTNVKGTIAMARERSPDSATSHFFVNLVDNTRLDPGGVDEWGYAVFGHVSQGWSVVEAIAKTPVRPDPQTSCPASNSMVGFDVFIQDVKILGS